MSTNIDILNDLEPSTLLDAMQINNSLQYQQLIQDLMVNTTSENVRTALINALDIAVEASGMYFYGFKTQPEAMLEVTTAQMQISELVLSGVALTVADIEAVNTATNMISNIVNSLVAHRSDLDVDTASKSLGSDTEELIYLTELQINADGATITDIAPSKKFTSEQKNDARELMNIIWQNEFVKRLVPLCAGFMVVCVALGVKYKV